MTCARFALVCTLAIGCTKANPQFCDDSVQCGTGMTCDKLPGHDQIFSRQCDEAFHRLAHVPARSPARKARSR